MGVEMIKILCIGDNVVDINYMDEMIHPGGNCINVAVYCAQLGYKSAYIGVLADDKYAKIVTDSLSYYGVEYSKSVMLHGETGRCSCQLVEGERVLGDENDGGLVKSNPLEITEDILCYAKNFDIIHTSCYSYIDNQLEKLRLAGIPLLYDFSTKWNNENVSEIAKNVDYILFSAKEELSQRENMDMLTSSVDYYGCKMSILTAGTAGAWVYDGKNVYQKEPYNVSGGAIDTTGCGDSWISGFITSYLEQAIRLKKMQANSDKYFLNQKNEEDFMTHVLELSMCMGNLKARQTCRIKGAYEWGVKIEDFNK